MLSVPTSVRIYFCCEACDMRKSFDGLERLVREVIEQEPSSGHLFVFRNRRGDRLKILFWERGGFVIHYKLLEKGTFDRPSSVKEGAVRIEAAELMMLLQGIDLTMTRRRRWWSPSSSPS